MAGRKNLVVVITGASSGIGAALVTQLAAAGHRVVATARRPETIAAGGDRVLPLALDVTDGVSIAAAVTAAVQWHGRIDVLVNNAGFGLIGPAAELDLDELRLQLETNLVGVLALTQAVVPQMVARRDGRIVNIGSVSGITATPFAGAYCASKAALHVLGDALRMELAPFGIRVITVQPGAVGSLLPKSSVARLRGADQEGSLYREVAHHVERRARLSQNKPTPAAEFAREMIRVVLGSAPPAVVRLGRGSRLLPAIRLLPTGLRDRLLRRRFGLGGELGGPAG